ncbi:MAG: aminotransferase class I/II-fold pyridoxal phosphate-dependent enzyme, partial [Clostridiales bacterium]
NTTMAKYLKDLGANLDITEISGFDDLHDAKAILANAMEHCADIWRSEEAYFLVNGSTCGILAGIAGATKYGDEIIVARNCHKSVYHAIELFGLKPTFITPPVDEKYGIAASIRPKDVKSAIAQHPKAKLVVITSPTYEGVISDLPYIAEIAHEQWIPLMVDEAHGAHLGFSPMFLGGAVAAGADIVVQSLHKTLPSLTQTAIAHLNGVLVDSAKFRRQLNIFETSSPSYLLMASIDQCVGLLEAKSAVLFANWEDALSAFNLQVKKLKNLRIFMYGADYFVNHEDIFRFDPSKIVISTINTNINACQLGKILLNDYQIELETTAGSHAIAMTGLGDTKDSLHRLGEAICAIDQTLTFEDSAPDPYSLFYIPPRDYGVTQVLNSEYVILDINQTLNETAADYVWAYPPGIPLITPGERVTQNFIDAAVNLTLQGVNLKCSMGGSLPRMRVLKK